MHARPLRGRRAPGACARRVARRARYSAAPCDGADTARATARAHGSVRGRPPARFRSRARRTAMPPCSQMAVRTPWTGASAPRFGRTRGAGRGRRRRRSTRRTRAARRRRASPAAPSPSRPARAASTRAAAGTRRTPTRTGAGIAAGCSTSDARAGAGRWTTCSAWTARVAGARGATAADRARAPTRTRRWRSRRTELRRRVHTAAALGTLRTAGRRRARRVRRRGAAARAALAGGGRRRRARGACPSRRRRRAARGARRSRPARSRSSSGRCRGCQRWGKAGAAVLHRPGACGASAFATGRGGAEARLALVPWRHGCCSAGSGHRASACLRSRDQGRLGRRPGWLLRRPVFE